MTDKVIGMLIESSHKRLDIDVWSATHDMAINTDIRNAAIVLNMLLNSL